MNQLGQIGEELGAKYLEQEGFVVLYKNWRYSRQEVDLIVENENFLIFVEVKTRKNDLFGKPEVAVNAKKQRFLIKAASAYCRTHKIKKEIRFDILAIIHNESKTEINHFENAFFPEFYL